MLVLKNNLTACFWILIFFLFIFLTTSHFFPHFRSIKIGFDFCCSFFSIFESIKTKKMKKYAECIRLCPHLNDSPRAEGRLNKHTGPVIVGILFVWPQPAYLASKPGLHSYEVTPR